jgi:hypothetical protein
MHTPKLLTELKKLQEIQNITIVHAPLDWKNSALAQA